MNLQILKRTRIAPVPGDFFVLKVLDKPFNYGRVIRIGVGPGGIGVLTYIYRASSEDKLPVPPLSRRGLLIPPFLTNPMWWDRGYFERVDSRPLGNDDVLPVHCFEAFGGINFDVPRYVDECGRTLQLPTSRQRFGTYAIRGIGTIDNEVSKALGVALSSEYRQWLDKQGD
jgi:hypothetical protein